MIRTTIVAVLIAASAPAFAAEVDWELVRPGGTGIPGEEVRFARFDPAGNLWVAARWPFWGEGGVAVLEPDTLGADGGAAIFDTGRWTTYVNWNSPIPSQFVNDIEFAPGGVTWLATSEGLVRFDGAEWFVYDTTNAPFLNNSIRRIDLDADGDLWIATNHALYVFDGSTWTIFEGDDLPWDPPWAGLDDVLVAGDGHVWVVSDALTGVAEYDGASWTLHGEGVDNFAGIMEDARGDIWLIADNLGYSIYRFDGSTFTEYDHTNTPLYRTTITTMALDDKGTVYIGNWMGQVVTYNDGVWGVFTEAPSRVYSILPRIGGVWVATGASVHVYDWAGRWIKGYNTYNTGMPWYWVDHMYLDRNGDFWIATGEAGASRFDGARWRNWGAHNLDAEPWPFLAEQAFGLYQDSAGAHWIGSNGVGRVIGNDLEIWDWRNTPAFGVEIFTYFAEDMHGTLFTMTRYGTTFRFDPENNTWLREPVQPYGPVGVPGMVCDRQGNVWIAAWFLLHKWDGQTWTTVGENWPLFDLGGVNCIAIAPDDTIWLGTNEGLLHWDGEDLALYDTTNSPLPAPEVQGIAFRDDGLMGLSAHEFGPNTPFPNGVAVIDGDIDDPARWSIYRYGETPLPHYQLGPVAFDGRGDLWVSALSEAAAVIRFRAQTVRPTSFETVFGAYRSGDVSDLHRSDDRYVVIEQRPAFSVLLPLIRLEVSATANGPTAAQIVVTVEAATNALPTQSLQKLLLLNYDTMLWELVDERTATLTDSVVEVTIDANPGRFIEDGTNAMRMRVDWFDPGNVFSPAWVTRTDQAVWTVVP